MSPAPGRYKMGYTLRGAAGVSAAAAVAGMCAGLQLLPGGLQLLLELTAGAEA